MAIGDPVPVTGYVTQDKFLIGRSLKVIEAYLGFQEGRRSRSECHVRSVEPRQNCTPTPTYYFQK
jgi:hypothetical protein